MMRRRLALFFAAATVAAASLATAQPPPASDVAGQPARWVTRFDAIASGPWTGARLPDGQPDVQGHWSNTVANQNNWTDPQAGAPGEPSKQASLPRDQRAPSRVSDPADGQMPYRPEARALQQDFEKNFSNPEKPRYVEPLARCAPGGPLKSFTWHGYEIRQFPGYAVFMFESSTRIIRLDGKPHLNADIKLWNGDSRGHWDGNTLVVDVTNNNGKALLGRTGDFFSENAHIEERYIFDKAVKHFNYVARVDDPTVFTRPWTATIPNRRYSEADPSDGWHYEVNAANRPGKPLLNERMERICVENNGPFGGGAVGVPLEEPIIAR